LRVVGEDVEDDRGAVDDRHLEGSLKVPFLPGSQFVVTGDEVSAGALDFRLDLFQLAATEVTVRIRFAAALDHLANRGDAGGPEQLAEFVQGPLPVRIDGDHHRPLPGPATA